MVIVGSGRSRSIVLEVCRFRLGTLLSYRLTRTMSSSCRCFSPGVSATTRNGNQYVHMLANRNRQIDGLLSPRLVPSAYRLGLKPRPCETTGLIAYRCA